MTQRIQAKLHKYFKPSAQTHSHLANMRTINWQIDVNYGVIMILAVGKNAISREKQNSLIIGCFLGKFSTSQHKHTFRLFCCFSRSLRFISRFLPIFCRVIYTQNFAAIRVRAMPVAMAPPHTQRQACAVLINPLTRWSGALVCVAV